MPEGGKDEVLKSQSNLKSNGIILERLGKGNRFYFQLM